jgi:branched-chain amino acid aminotransferase
VKVWLNGSLVEDSAARVAFNDHGLTVGDGVFETIKTYAGVPFAVKRHLERLAHSAAGLGLEPPSAADLRDAITLVCEANGVGDAAVRVTVTGGPGPLGSARGTEGLTVIVANAPLTSWPDTVDVATVPWPRNERGATAGLKTTSYAENVVALARAKQSGATEAIFANTAGRLCEGTGTNVFLTVDGRMVTPPLSVGCLAGVTRALLVEAGLADELDVPLAALAEADEAFLSSTTREVHPIARVDGQRLPSCPGPLTRAAAEVFAALVAGTPDP